MSRSPRPLIHALVLLGASTPRPASAEPLANVPTSRVTPAPAASFAAPGADQRPPIERAAGEFISLDPISSSTTLALRASMIGYQETYAEITAMRLGLFGQFVSDAGVGAYASLAASYYQRDHSISGEAGTDPIMTNVALGGLELGGVAVRRSDRVELIGRVGVVLPTAPTAGEQGALTNLLATYAQVSDIATATPRSTWLRLSASPVLRSGRWIVRVDLGLDVPLSTADGAPSHALGRLNAAAGLLLGRRHQLSLETATAGDLRAHDDARVLHSAGFSYRVLGRWQPFVGIHQTWGHDSAVAPETFATAAMGGVATEL